MKTLLSHLATAILGAAASFLWIGEPASHSSPSREAPPVLPSHADAASLGKDRSSGYVSSRPGTRPQPKSGRDALQHALEISDPAARLNALLEAAIALAAEGPDAYSAIESIRHLTLKRVASDAFFQELAKQDPEAAWAGMLAAKMPVEFPSWTAVMEAMVCRNPAEASKNASSARPGPLRDRLIAVVAETWGAADPLAALRWTQSLSSSLERSQMTLHVIESVGRIDPRRSAELALILEPGKSRDTAIALASAFQANANPEIALSWIERLPQCDQDTAYRGLLETLSATDPTKAATLIDKLKASPSKNELIIKIAGEMALADWNAATTWLEDRGVLADPDIAAPVLWVMGQQSPREAAVLLSGLAYHPSISDHVEQIAQAYFDETSPEVAVAWVDGLPDAEMRKVALAALFESWARTDPAAALQHALEPVNRTEVFSVLAKSDPEALLAHFEAGDNGQESIPAGEYVSALAKDAPEAALKILGSMEGEEAQFAVEELATSWTRTNPNAAAASSLTLPRELGDSFRQAVLRGWLEEDPVAAAQWVDSLSTGEIRDAAIVAVVESVRTTDPEGAALWLQAIGNPEIRTRAASRR